MNKQVRRLFAVLLIMFAALGIAATYIQFFEAPSLNADGRNTRTILRAAQTERGSIIVAGQPIVTSKKNTDNLRYERTYSQGPLYAGVTGYYSTIFNNSTGLEHTENSILNGDSHYLFLQHLHALFTGAGSQAGAVELTLNQQMQQVAEEKLGNRRGAVVVLNARTGAILALYSSPSFDPNPLASFDSKTVNDTSSTLSRDPRHPLDNRAIAGNTYAPGSTFKLITSIAMLENGVSPTTSLSAPVETMLPGTQTPVANNEETTCGNGHPPFEEAFARSCNTAFVIASQKLPPNALSEVTKRFHFGEPLRIPLDVTPSQFPQNANAAQLALSAIGQYDVKVTPLQMAMIAQAIANDGHMMKPFLVQKILDGDLQVSHTNKPQPFGEPLSQSVSATMKKMMRDVVDKPYGTANGIQIPGLSIAAKTGTAETGDKDNHANAWIVGFAPAENPQVAFAVLVEGDDSDPVPHGGTVAGPVAKALLEVGLKQ